MVSHAPVVGLVLASPVVLRALTGAAGVEDALVAWLVGMVVAAAGLWVLAQILRPGPAAGDVPRAGRPDGSAGRRRQDTPAR